MAIAIKSTIIAKLSDTSQQYNITKN